MSNFDIAMRLIVIGMLFLAYVGPVVFILGVVIKGDIEFEKAQEKKSQ